MRAAPPIGPRGQLCVLDNEWTHLLSYISPLMKTILPLLVLALTSLAGEPLKLPKSVKMLTDLEEAKSQAASANKGISWMLMDPVST